MNVSDVEDDEIGPPYCCVKATITRARPSAPAAGSKMSVVMAGAAVATMPEASSSRSLHPIYSYETPFLRSHCTRLLLHALQKEEPDSPYAKAFAQSPVEASDVMPFLRTANFSIPQAIRLVQAYWNKRQVLFGNLGPVRITPPTVLSYADLDLVQSGIWTILPDPRRTIVVEDLRASKNHGGQEERGRCRFYILDVLSRSSGGTSGGGVHWMVLANKPDQVANLRTSLEELIPIMPLEIHGIHICLVGPKVSATEKQALFKKSSLSDLCEVYLADSETELGRILQDEGLDLNHLPACVGGRLSADYFESWFRNQASKEAALDKEQRQVTRRLEDRKRKAEEAIQTQLTAEKVRQEVKREKHKMDRRELEALQDEFLALSAQSVKFGDENRQLQQCVREATGWLSEKDMSSFEETSTMVCSILVQKFAQAIASLQPGVEIPDEVSKLHNQAEGGIFLQRIELLQACLAYSVSAGQAEGSSEHLKAKRPQGKADGTGKYGKERSKLHDQIVKLSDLNAKLQEANNYFQSCIREMLRLIEQRQVESRLLASKIADAAIAQALAQMMFGQAAQLDSSSQSALQAIANLHVSRLIQEFSASGADPSALEAHQPLMPPIVKPHAQPVAQSQDVGTADTIWRMLESLQRPANGDKV